MVTQKVLLLGFCFGLGILVMSPADGHARRVAPWGLKLADAQAVFAKKTVRMRLKLIRNKRRNLRKFPSRKSKTQIVVKALRANEDNIQRTVLRDYESPERITYRIEIPRPTDGQYIEVALNNEGYRPVTVFFKIPKKRYAKVPPTSVYRLFKD